MTTHEERKRNLIWGRGFLEEFAQDGTLPAPVRRLAAELLLAYPSTTRLEDCELDQLQDLQDEFSGVFAKTRELFQRLQLSESTSEQRRYSMRVVLRHFN